MANKVQALVVGAGISGLSTAFGLQKAGIDTLLVESAARPGGVIKSVKRDGYLVECGPQSFSGNAYVTALCQDLGILEERLVADSRAPRYVLIDGKLQLVPMSPPSLLFSSLMGGGTRTAIVRDIFGKSQAPEPDESVANFIRRKYSSTLLDRLVGPFVSGIYAGDPEKLSLRAAFPILYQAEKASGSILRGIFKVMKSKKKAAAPGPRERPTLQSFREGNETLVQALAAKLGDRLRCATEISYIDHIDSSPQVNAPRFRITLRGPRGAEIIEAERLVLAVPTDVAGKLLARVDSSFESDLVPVEYSGVAVVSLAYRDEDLGHPADGFGFLVPRSSKLSILGTVWNSSLFPGRAPEGHTLITNFVGGATNPGALGTTGSDLVAQVHRELTPLMDARKEPVFSNVTIWQRAIPQYNLGHTARLANLETTRAKYPGLWFAGNYLTGPAVGTCVEQAAKVADEVRVSFAN
ncbi:MAG TPA: protoporphyrinogen oxidase [Candidatus Acidoferrum sp.]|jgi:oxygen-dependent protoporphyrinogen oxidase